MCVPIFRLMTLSFALNSLTPSAYAQSEGSDSATTPSNQSSSEVPSTQPVTEGDETSPASTLNRYEENIKRRAEAVNAGINPEQPKYDGKLRPDGKALPQKVLRVRIPVTMATATHGYDADGKKLDQGLRLKASGTGLVFEYGLTDKLSAQLLTTYVTSNKLGIDADAFRSSKVYKENYDAFVATAAETLAATAGSGCTTKQKCIDLINNGYALPFDQTFSIPQTGESLNIKANVPLRNYADSIVINGAKASLTGSGATGFGDLILGLLYEVTDHTSPLYFSIGGGFRMPTGKSVVDSGQRTTSRSVYEIGLRTNLDYDLLPGMMLSWQNQMEVPVSKGKRKTGEVRSLVNPDRVLIAAEEKDYERVGVRNVGYFHLRNGLGVYNPSLRFFEVKAGVDYNYDHAERYDGEESTARNYSWQSNLGASVSLLPLKLPFELNWDHYMPLAGKNTSLVATSDLVTIKAYYLF